MANSSHTLPATSHVGRVALRVTDLDRMVEFYRNVVGLAVQHRGAERATLGGDEPLLELHADPDAPERGRNETGLFHTAFRVPSRAVLGDALGRIRDRWRLDGASDHLVSEALYLSDPENNGVEVYRDRPQEEWPTNPDGTVGMDTRRLDVDAVGDLGSGETTVPDGTTVGHVHLEVSSLSDAQAFYVDALGMNLRQRFGESALFVAAGDYHHHVGLNVWNGRTEPASGRGLEWFELVVPGRDVIDAVKERLSDREVDFSETDGEIEASDPDGIELHVRVED
jgi:catechol 2,3-dioxygenase